VTAFGREEVREEAERLQLDGFLVKPVTKSMIVDTLVNVFAQEGEAMEAAADAEPSSRLRGASILLTEDNEINQQIAMELLEGAGAVVTVANNGREVVDILSNGPQPPPFDLVLMDLQMPEMDGYQATARLRSDARFATLPIIAMTAHATMEEKQRCLAAGMNDHISKPIDPGNLFDTLGRFYKPKEAAPAKEERAASGPPPKVTTAPQQSDGRAPQPDDLPTIKGLDAKDGLTRVAGNRKLYLKLLRQFVDLQVAAPAEIAGALARSDFAEAERIAHSVKGVAGNLGAAGVQQTAAQLEKSLAAKVPSSEAALLLREFEAVLGDMAGRLRAVLPAVETAIPAATLTTVLDPAQAARVVREMLGHLNQFDPAAGDCLEANREVFRVILSGEKFSSFEQQVGGFAFSEALALLEPAAQEKGLLPT
jgi:two-component system sensor histidine kinase/response regulator